MSLASVAFRVLLRIDGKSSTYPLINLLLIFCKCGLPSLFSKGSSLCSPPGWNRDYFNSIVILVKIDFHVALRLSEWVSFILATGKENEKRRWEKRNYQRMEVFVVRSWMVEAMYRSLKRFLSLPTYLRSSMCLFFRQNGGEASVKGKENLIPQVFNRFCGLREEN